MKWVPETTRRITSYKYLNKTHLCLFSVILDILYSREALGKYSSSKTGYNDRNNGKTERSAQFAGIDRIMPGWSTETPSETWGVCERSSLSHLWTNIWILHLSSKEGPFVEAFIFSQIHEIPKAPPNSSVRDKRCELSVRYLHGNVSCKASSPLYTRLGHYH